MALNEKQKLFAQNLLKYKFNQTKAYMESYPDSSKESAMGDASRLLGNANISKYIQQLIEKQEKQTLVTVEEVINGIKEDINGAKLNNQFSAALKGRELLGKYLKMFTEKHEHTGKDGQPIETYNLSKEDYEKIRQNMIKKDDI